MKYFHVDVFSEKSLSGNGLTVVFPDKKIDHQTLLSITQECKQFETIFIYPSVEEQYPVRIFTVEEELNFAGHPILGAGAVIHKNFHTNKNSVNIDITAASRVIHLTSERRDDAFQVVMDQGEPQFIKTVSYEKYQVIAAVLNLDIQDFHEEYPIEIVSTGLPYMLIPLKKNLGKAKIVIPNFDEVLAQFGAKFVYLFDPKSLECRTWDNEGNVEDVATGSAAGPLCAYLVKNGFKQSGEVINIYQGKYVNRPSRIQGWVSEGKIGKKVFIRGEVAFFGAGELFI